MKNLIRRRRKALVILLILSIFIGSAYVLGWSSIFSVKEVVVVGAPTKSESEEIRRSVRLGDKLARIEPRTLNATLQNFAWLRTSAISRNWISGTVTIRVFTRIPVARNDGRLIDEEGNLFTLPGSQSSKLPTINASSKSALIFAVKLLNFLPDEIKNSLISISASGPRSARLILNTNAQGKSRKITIFWGDLTNSELKARVYKALLDLPENAKVKVIDVSAPHAPIVK